MLPLLTALLLAHPHPVVAFLRLAATPAAGEAAALWRGGPGRATPAPPGVHVASPSGPDRVPPASVVSIPRVADAQVAIDGRLDEPVWQQAAVLRDFSQYLPTDNRPADDSTVVLVWYSPTAIYFGIRAYQDSASVRATLADRDKVGADDWVDILLDTFDDHRQALVFGVNPLGVQSDGTLTDAPRQIINLTTSAVVGAYTLDLSPDYVYESKGRLTSWGYEVEMRIPFKTLRYQARDPQDWGVQVMRMVQATGHQQTWTRVLQTEASFLAQSGALQGLTDLHRGLVLDVTPEVTSTVTGAPDSSGWRYGGGQPKLGLTARWGVTSNLALNGTVRPDFSQVEADVPQIQFDPRVALYYPEKRPFFLDGLELFQTPVRLIYTRRLVDPQGAVRLAGKVGGTTIAALSGVDGTDASATGTDHPFMNVLRLRQDLGGQNSLGLVYTDRVDGAGFNRVAALDGAWVPEGAGGGGGGGGGGAWSFTFQGGASATKDSAGAAVQWAPMWYTRLVRSGRRFSLDVRTSAVGDNFRAASGFIQQTGVVQASVTPTYTIAGAPGSWLENFSANVYLGLTWNQYDYFTTGRAPDTRQADFATGFTLRGGWQIGLSWTIESFGYPAQLYKNYWIERVTPGSGGGPPVVDTIPFTGQARIPNLDLGINFQTPRWQSFSLSGFLIANRDENYYEWAPALIYLGTADLLWRPTSQIRAELVYNHQQIIRRDGGSTVALIRVPQLRLEYQIARPLFVRLIGEYTSTEIDALRDDSRTGGAILIRDPVTGTFTRTARTVTDGLRMDWLVSYRPTPGTVVFVGYGSSLDDTAPFVFRGLNRTADGFFLKLSYLYRV